MEIYVCVGSSCHLKDSYDIIAHFKDAIKRFGLSDEVQLKGTFCLGHCAAEGVSVKIGSQIITGVTAGNVEAVFKRYVLDKEGC